MKGELLYRIANLERVWVLADVHRADVALLGAIGKARDPRGRACRRWRHTSRRLPPQFDDQGRTGKLRLEVNNPRGNLLPGMIVDVELDAPARSAVTVHADAVIDSGTKKRVFVALGGGQYELREVETGWQEGDRVEIRGGLKAGERVVTAGAFLLDSESRMKSTRATTMIDRLIEFSARRRGTVIGLVLALAIWGAWSMPQIPLDALPDLSDTQVILYSRWDRSPDLIEDQVTYPIVTAMLGAPKVKAVRGVSDFGYSFVYVIFEDGTDLYWARSRTQEYLAGVLSTSAGGSPDGTRTGCHRPGLGLSICLDGRLRKAVSGGTADHAGLLSALSPALGSGSGGSGVGGRFCAAIPGHRGRGAPARPGHPVRRRGGGSAAEQRRNRRPPAGVRRLRVHDPWTRLSEAIRASSKRRWWRAAARRADRAREGYRQGHARSGNAPGGGRPRRAAARPSPASSSCARARTWWTSSIASSASCSRSRRDCRPGCAWSRSTTAPS